MLLSMGIGYFLIVLPFNKPISGPNTFSERSASSGIILLFLIRFILIIALRSLAVGVPKAWNAFQAFLAYSYWHLNKQHKLSSTILVN